MTITYPTWWKGFRWDVEELQRDLFTYPNNVAAVGLSGIRVEPFTADGEDIANWIEAGNGVLFVHRSGGHINKTSNPYVDESILVTAALTTSRHESNVLMEYVASVYDAFEGGGTVQRSEPHRSGATTTFMSCDGEVVGPQLDPTLIRDERMTPAIWRINATVPHGLPDYRLTLGLDN